MPSAFDPVKPGGGGSSGAADYNKGIKQSNQSQVVGAGKIQVSITDPSTTIQNSIGNFNAGFIGMGKGLVSIAENLPVVGAVAKPIIGLVGGIADATIGQVVKGAEGIRVGDQNLAQAAVGALENIGSVTVKPAFELLTGLGIETERAVGRARILSTKNNQKDFIVNIFGEAPQAALDSMSAGATLEDAAEQLAASNAGFSQNGAANFLWSLLLDPMNIVLPGVGKAVSASAQAAKFAAIGADVFVGLEKTARATGDLALAAKYAEELAFLNKYEFFGKVYSQTLGKLSNFTKRYSSTIAKESVLGWTRVVSVQKVNPFLDSLVRISGKEVVDRGLTSYARTFANAIKSGSLILRATISRSGGADSADRFVGHIIDGFAEGKTKAQILSQPAKDVDMGTYLKELGLADEDLNKLMDFIESNPGIRADEIRRYKEITDVRDKIAKLEGNARIRNDKTVLQRGAAFRGDTDSRLASEEAIRVLRQDKDNRIPAASNREQGIRELTEDIVAGFGARFEDAQKVAIEQFDRLAGDISGLADVLALARGAANGQAMQRLAVLRNALAGKTITITTKKGQETVTREVDLGKLTMLSTRSITRTQSNESIKVFDALEVTLNQAIKDGDESVINATKQQLKAEADRLVSSFDDFGKRFARGKYTYSEIRSYLDKSVNRTVQEIGVKERAVLVARSAKDPAIRQVLEVEKELEKLGYRLGIAPEDDLIDITSVVTDHYGRETIDSVLMPFSDTLDLNAIDGLDNALLSEKLRPTKLGAIWDKLSRPYGPEIVKNNIAERFVTSMVQKTGISVNKARQIFVEVNNVAARRGADQELGGGRLQGLFVVRSQINEIFDRIMDKDYGRLRDAGTDPIKEIFSAAAGDWSVSGLTSGFTGRIKAIAPEITVLTDILYPEVRFGKLNPYFNLLLERAETQIQRVVHRIRTDTIDEITGEARGAVARRAALDPRNVNREINDAVQQMSNRSTRATTATVLESTTLRKRVSDRVRKWFSIQGVKDTKEVARDMTADQFANREFLDVLEKNAPGALSKLAEHFGTTNAEEVLQLLLNEYLIHSDPILFARHVEKTGKVARRLSVDELITGGLSRDQAENIVAATFNAYEVTLLRASRAADKAQYFSSSRSWFERSMNHPFLAFYPYSYMTQKAIPSLLKIMFLSPGFKGQVYPGYYFNQYTKVEEWMTNSANSDQDVLSQIAKDDSVLWLFTTLLPVTPDTIGYAMPAWVRRGIIQPGLRGTPLTPGALAPAFSEVVSQVGRGTALGQARTTLEGLQGVDNAVKSNENIGDFIQSNLEFIKEKTDSLRNP